MAWIMACFSPADDLWAGRGVQPIKVVIQRLTFNTSYPGSAYLYLDVTRMDGSTVPGLKSDNFELTIDGRYAVVIDHIVPFAGSDRDLAYVLLVDNNEALATSLTMIRQGAWDFLQAMGFRYWGTVVTYANRPGMLVRPTRDARYLAELVAGLEPVEHAPQLADGLLLAVEVLTKTVAEHHLDRSRTAVILFTEGRDEGSRFSLQAASSKVVESGTQFFLIGYGQTGASSIAVLRELAERTGGRWYYLPNPDDIPAAMLKVADILKNQYIIGFNHERFADGAEHSVEIAVSGYGYKGNTSLRFIGPRLKQFPPGWPLYLGCGAFLFLVLMWRRRGRT